MAWTFYLLKVCAKGNDSEMYNYTCVSDKLEVDQEVLLEAGGSSLYTHLMRT